MRNLSVIALAACVLSIGGIVPVRSAHSAQSDETAVRQAADDFYSALNAMFKGNVEPMNAVWSHADDVTYMGPDGKFTVGWDQVLTDWQSQAATKLGGQVQSEQIHVTVGQDLATVECREVGENIVDGKPTPVALRATNVFRKENGQWKMIGHHTDKLPFMEQ
jgi:ketosteroid isomerase-like protein